MLFTQNFNIIIGWEEGELKVHPHAPPEARLSNHTPLGLGMAWAGVKLPRDMQASRGPSPGPHGGLLAPRLCPSPTHSTEKQPCPCVEAQLRVSDLCFGHVTGTMALGGQGWAQCHLKHSFWAEEFPGACQRKREKEDSGGRAVTRPLPNFQALTYSDSP